MNRGSLLACYALAVAATLIDGATVGAASKPVTYVSVPLLVSLRDAAATDGVLSDNGGFYTDGQQNVKAVLVANINGNFVFDTNDQSNIDGGRRLVLDFHGQPNLPFAAPVPFPVDVFLGSLPVNSTDTDNLQTMRAGETHQRRTRLAWVDGDQQYSLRWDGPENGHTFLSFHCDIDDGAVTPHCTQWTVTPDGIAGLYSVPTKGKTVDTYYGAYSMPFSMTLLKK